MRILSGPARPDPHFRIHHALGAIRDHDVLRFGPDPSLADVAYRAGSDRWDHVLQRLPAGWEPELVLFWDPHYHPLPLGFERCPCPTAAIFMDWFFWPPRAGIYAGFFDALFTNPTGARFLRAAGLHVAGEINYLGVDWERFAADPAAPRDLDVCMVTSLDHFARPRRARHLERLARLSLDGLRLHVTNDAYGADYPALLACAKVVINDSDYDILNSRTFEGLASGAAVLEERRNPEARALFTDGYELAFYDEQDLEERLRSILADDPGRIALARRGQQAARACSYEARVAATVATVVKATRRLPAVARPATDWPAGRTLAASTALALSALVQPDEPSAWQRAYVETPFERLDDVRLLCALALIGTRVAQDGNLGLLSHAARALTRAQELVPGDPVTRFNLARLHEVSGAAQRAAALWRQLAEESPEPPHPADHGWYVDSSLPRDLLPGYLTRLAVQPGAEAGTQAGAAAGAQAAVLRQAACLALAELHRAQGSPGDARHWYRAAEEPTGDTNLGAVAARLHAAFALGAGDLAEAQAALRQATERCGLFVEAWVAYGRVMRVRGERDACRQWCAERAAMLEGFPPYTAVRAELLALARETGGGPEGSVHEPEASAARAAPGNATGHVGPASGGDARRRSAGRDVDGESSDREGTVAPELSQPERWLAEARELFVAGRRFDCLQRCLEKMRVLERVPDLAPPDLHEAFRQLRAQCLPGISNPLVAEFVPGTARSFLDVGCGFGELSGFLKQGDPERFACGIELDAERARQARERLDLIVVADLDTLAAFPQRPGGFDCVIFADVLEHLKRPEAALRAAADVLAPHGAVVISVPNARHWHLVKQLVVDGEWRYVDSGILDRTHLRFFTLASLQRLLADADFEVDGGISALGIAPDFDPAPLARAVAELGGDPNEFAHHLGLFQFCLRARPRHSL